MASELRIPAADIINSEDIARRVAELGDWFHNINLHGVQTAPAHFLGDYPNVKWRHLSQALPPNLEGKSVLDVGCNGGFYSIALKQRGATRVLGVDVVDQYLEQARFAADTLELNIEFQKCSVYDVDQIAGQFDIVLFMGVFYHLRYPLLALDKVVTKVRGTLIFQTMLRGSDQPYASRDDYDFWEQEMFNATDFPAAYFIEKRYANDPTNWFIPNRSGAEAMLRSAGLNIVAHPEAETWLCTPGSVRRDGRYILDLELEGKL